jgi:hypothetical protein
MRKITVLSMITLDGVMQAPGGPGEDTSGGFKYGGWTALYGDELFGIMMGPNTSCRRLWKDQTGKIPFS